jgi:pimeloyl-ACP methyl ester carboxylesterase
MIRLSFVPLTLVATLLCLAWAGAGPASAAPAASTRYRTIDVDGVRVFYREAGDRAAPVLLLLHGYPTSSHMFRDLIPRLAERYHVVAPDLPGFGFSAQPDRATFAYTFAHLATLMTHFTEAAGLGRYAIYLFDYGAPIGLRMAMAHPERVTAIVSQNGNAYEEGLGPNWVRLRKIWADPTEANRNSLRPGFSPEANLRRYLAGVPEADRSLVSPDSYTSDDAFLAHAGNDQVQLDLLMDYGTNIALYPRFQEYLRTNRPPLLAIWGRHDPTFIPAGAEAFRRDIPDAEIRLLDAGHFALETRGEEIADAMLAFLGKHLKSK